MRETDAALLPDFRLGAVLAFELGEKFVRVQHLAKDVLLPLDRSEVTRGELIQSRQPRGSLGRGPSEWEADLHVSYPVKLGQKARLNLVADVFNIFNRQAISPLDERYNLNSDPPCSGIPDSSCNGDGGLLALPNTVDPAFSIANARATATNPDFLKKGIAFTSPRSIRLGLRLTF